MTTTKRLLEGDTSRFAFGVTFQKDPDDGTGAIREESLSWGGVELWVEGMNLCLHREGDAIVDEAHWYLLPLLEWLSANWDQLLHEERLPLRVAADDSWKSLQATATSPPSYDDKQEEQWEIEWRHWWLQHDLLACRQGGLFPDVVFRRWRDRIEISWGQRRLAGQPAYFQFFASEGFARLPVADVAGPLFAVLWQAADYLLTQEPTSDRFKSLRASLDSLKLPHRRHKRLALLARLGSAVADQYEKRWDDVNKWLATKPIAAKAAKSGIDEHDLFISGSCQAALMFGSVAPTIDDADAMAIARKLIDLYAPSSESARLRNMVREELIDDGRQRPWAQGYSLAEEVLEHLLLPGDSDEWVDVRKIYSQLGIGIEELHLNDYEIRAISLAGPEHRPSTLLNPNHATCLAETGRRFTLAHELCHMLFDRGYGTRLAIASGPWAPRDIEARANAFAAMLLMPTKLIRNLIPQLSSSVTSGDGIRELAQKLHTSVKSTLEHLKNLSFLSEEEHDRIEYQNAQ